MLVGKRILIWLGIGCIGGAAAVGGSLMLTGTVQEPEPHAEPSLMIVYQEPESISTSAAAAAQHTTSVTTAAGTTTVTTTSTTKAVTTARPRTTTTAPRTRTQRVAAEEPPLEVTFPLELNAASVEELSALPGIGVALAERIAAYRDAIGGFRNRNQLLEVDGIGAQRFAEIYPLLYLEIEYLDEEELLPDPEEELPPEQIPEEPELPPEEIPILDVNLATAEDFAKLPGVDEELAQRIVELRELIGYFENPLELLYTEGMSDALYLSIEQYLIVERET